jgi:UDP-N-acetylglucosamine 2-epimerase (non-hydrolysing)
VIHFVVGTRAQLFKLAPVMLECERRGLQWRWVYTGQHRETIDASLQTFGLPSPAYVVVRWRTEAKSRGLMARWMGRMILALPRSRSILAGQVGAGHVVVTHGDTFTTWLAALMGRLTRTNVLHVEAGLRSFDLRKPFPEELNRLITFRLATFFAAPDSGAAANLARYRGETFVTDGNTQIDTLRYGLEHLGDADAHTPDEPYAVASLHRYENVFDRERLEEIVALLERIAHDRLVVFVRHPVTDAQLKATGLAPRLEHNERILLLPRLEYLPFLALVRSSDFVLSDGGGNQEELSYLGIPTLLLRDETERHEGLGENAVLSRFDRATIDAFLADPADRRREERLPENSPSVEIVDFLERRGFGR